MNSPLPPLGVPLNYWLGCALLCLLPPGLANADAADAFPVGSTILLAQATAEPPIPTLRTPTPPADTIADRVLGQPNFVSAAAGGTASMLDHPSDVLADPVSGRLWVADSANHRVLSWASAKDFTNGQAADLVLGQPDFTTVAPTRSFNMTAATLAQPAGMAVDAQGRLYVADYRNSRVLQYTPPFTNGMAASLVFGKPGFTDSRVGPTSAAESLFNPQGVAIDAAGNLFVADTSRNRVVRYSRPFSNGMAADLVLGQADMNSSRQNQGGTTTATTLSRPMGLTFDTNGNLYVVDSFNFRVLQYAPPFTNNMPATQVLGAPDFFSRYPLTMDAYTISQSSGAVAADPFGNIYVADTSNSRVLQFQPPITTGQAALRAFGQPDLASRFVNNGSIGPATVAAPSGVTADAEGRVYIADTRNNRILAFD